MSPTKQEYERVMNERSSLVTRQKYLQVEVSEIRTKIKRTRRSLPDREFEHLNELRREIGTIEGRLAELKGWLRNNHISSEGKEHPELPDGKPRKVLDEYDLINALSEPQMLLRHMLVICNRTLRQTGFRDGDRETLERVEDYLRRHGIAL